MKKLIFALSLAGISFPVFSQVIEVEGVEVLTDSYGGKISHDGSKIIGETYDGSTTYYDRLTGEAYYYENCNYGRGYVVSDNGWVVGCILIDDQATRAVIMEKGDFWHPEVFDSSISSNIHSITPDGSRICGVIGNAGNGPTYFPYYCDIDGEGNIGEIHILPTPEKDFFEQKPQYCSATWISEDGKTIAGQVIDARGVFVYPIIYTCSDEGVWSYSFPSKSLFNPDNLPVPYPLGEMDEEFPDAPYPDLKDFMTDEEYEEWQEVLYFWEADGSDPENSPYEFLDLYMSQDEYNAYMAAVAKFEKASEEYNEMMWKYWDELYKIADTSVFFERNAMALSADGKWLTSSALVDDLTGILNPVSYYVPYLMNIVTGEVLKIGEDKWDLITDQVFKDGSVIANTPPTGRIPARSFIYLPANKSFTPIQDFIAAQNPAYGEWIDTYLTGEVPVDVNDDGTFIYETVTLTGLVSASEDFSVFSGGVDGFAINDEMYLTYIMVTGDADVKSIASDEIAGDIYRVYNLQGVKVMETRNLDTLNLLSKGIYIVNGKKIKI